MIFYCVSLIFCLVGLSSCSIYEKQQKPLSWCGIIQSVDKQKDGRYVYILHSQNTSAQEGVKLVHPYSFAPQTMICIEGASF